MKTNTGVAPATGQHKARYIGEQTLAGITSNGPLFGLYWTVGNTGLFQPSGSTLVFTVAENDIELLVQ